MVEITEVDPDKKYILSITEPMSDAQVVHLRQRLDEFLQQEAGLAIIAGSEITLVPVDQVIGFAFREERDGAE